MTQPTDPTQPMWGGPPAGPPPPRRGGRRGLIIGMAVVGALLAIVVPIVLIASLPGSKPHATVSGTTTAPSETTPASEPSQETQPAEEPTTEAPAEPPTANVGETLTITNELDKKVLEVTVDRVRFSRGSEFDKPDHGRYLLAHVRVKALADDVTTPTLYVLERGEKYDTTIAMLDAGPSYEEYKSLSAGQSHQGLVVFDVPQQHGQIALAGDNNAPIGYWTF